MYTYEQVRNWYDWHQSAFYLFDPERLLANYQRMQQAFTRHYPHVVIAYSYKTNYLPALCQTLHEAGAYAEVVSRLEYDLAIKLGVPRERIVFNGPLKREQDLVYALAGKSLVNLDCMSELDTVLDYAHRYPQQEVCVGLRVNFDLSEDGVSPLQEGFPVSRFGFCLENGDFLEALQELQSMPNIRVVGLHGHFSTNRSLRVYERITQTLCQLANTYLRDSLRFIDVGGGMYGCMPATISAKKVPSFEEYAAVIGRVLQAELGSWSEKPVLILEPGISLVADTISFVCQVIDCKESRGQRFVTVDGSVHNIKPSMHKHALPMTLISQQQAQACEQEQDEQTATYHVVGYTCMEKDYLQHNHAGSLPQVGDFLLFTHVGAYTMVFQPPFIKEKPPVLAIRGGSVRTVRRKETIAEFLPATLYPFAEQALEKGMD